MADHLIKHPAFRFLLVLDYVIETRKMQFATFRSTRRKLKTNWHAKGRIPEDCITFFESVSTALAEDRRSLERKQKSKRRSPSFSDLCTYCIISDMQNKKNAACFPSSRSSLTDLEPHLRSRFFSLIGRPSFLQRSCEFHRMKVKVMVGCIIWKWPCRVCRKRWRGKENKNCISGTHKKAGIS
jgi:hypothetical protein